MVARVILRRQPDSLSVPLWLPALARAKAYKATLRPLHTTDLARWVRTHALHPCRVMIDPHPTQAWQAHTIDHPLVPPRPTLQQATLSVLWICLGRPVLAAPGAIKDLPLLGAS